ncbi:MAG: flavin reductase, partial [Lachnospiraceae bacterium]|nr:flavin reductase [Lachnospiraceae bacterium]
MNNKAMYALSYGLFVVSTKVGEKDNGCITNTAIQVTSDPNQIALAVNCANYTNELMKQAGIF